ncbi:MAG: hypothetical protein ACYTG6_04835 [Planctomycetota bacterium]|jgi:hypothetical protein
MARSTYVFVLMLACVALAGCVTSSRTAGVNNVWRAACVNFESGRTTEQEVLDQLGPPSQVIALRDYTVYYYLLESTQDDKLITILYNTESESVYYDRAIFFFDHQGILQRWSSSKECLPLRRGPQTCR